MHQGPMPGVAEALGRALHGAVEVLFSGFRLDFEGELPVRPVHFDSECGEWAAVPNLNLPHQCVGGTAFWRHLESRVDGVPEGSPPSREAWYHAESDNPEAWEMATLVAMRFNRMVVYPTRYFHSRWPLEGFGASPRDGRSIGGLFFNLRHAAAQTTQQGDQT